MKLFPQLALVSAIAISGNAFAMEALNDATLSNTTGQDGITIAIKPPTKQFDSREATTYFPNPGVVGAAGFAGVLDIASVRIHDKDGYNGSNSAGAIVLDGFSLAGSEAIIVKIDADGGTGGTAPLLNVNVALPSTLVIRTGDISVAASNGIGAALGTQSAVILDSMDIVMGQATMNIQLGNEAQLSNSGTGTAMINFVGNIDGGLQINNLKLNDANSGGSISVDNITLIDNGGTALTLDASINVVAGGLQVRSGGAPIDIRMSGVTLGDATAVSLGDVELVGVDAAGTMLTISGH
jgi:hypothetical protein